MFDIRFEFYVNNASETGVVSSFGNSERDIDDFTITYNDTNRGAIKITYDNMVFTGVDRSEYRKFNC